MDRKTRITFRLDIAIDKLALRLLQRCVVEFPTTTYIKRKFKVSIVRIEPFLHMY